MKFQDIPQLPRAYWNAHFEWFHLEETLDRWINREIPRLNLDPDYQREHVWTREQQIAYVEYMLQGGEVGRQITFNCAGWQGDYRGPFELVDGKQRLEAARAWMRDEFKTFGLLCSEFEGPRRLGDLSFNFRVCTLDTRAEIIQLYLNINAGGTPHTREELNRVRALLAQEYDKGPNND